MDKSFKEWVSTVQKLSFDTRKIFAVLFLNVVDIKMWRKDMHYIRIIGDSGKLIQTIKKVEEIMGYTHIFIDLTEVEQTYTTVCLSKDERVPAVFTINTDNLDNLSDLDDICMMYNVSSNEFRESAPMIHMFYSLKDNDNINKDTEASSISVVEGLLKEWGILKPDETFESVDGTQESVDTTDNVK